jgi:hypothetical protein
MPTASTATSTSSVTYTASSSNSWSSDSLTAQSSGFTNATIQFKK